jgi:tetratricopeptide (TPR) repeat protein
LLSYVNNCTRFNSMYCLRPLLLLCLGLLVWPGVEAGVPELYGRDYYRHGESWADASPPRLSVAIDEGRGSDEESYREQLTAQELSGGPYSDELAEPLSSLGHYYQNRGNYGQAVHFYSRALHVVRVNDGLYSERQIPLVRSLLDTYRLAGDLNELDERYEYFFRLYGSGQPPYTDLRLRASLEFLRWQREALRLEIDPDGNRRLLDLYELNKRILDSASTATDMSTDWYGQLVDSQIRNLYLIQSEVEIPDDFYAFRTRESIQPNPQDIGLDSNLQRLGGIARSSAARGRILLEGMLVRTEATGSADETAAIHLALGDWHQWNNNSRLAGASYLQVVESLQKIGDKEKLDQWLGSPAELPVNGAYWQSDSSTAVRKKAVLVAQYDVSSRGKARNIRISALKLEDEVYESRLRRKLSATRFRPRYLLGTPEAFEGVNHKYELIVD